MTTVFEGSPEFGGISCDYAHVIAIRGLVLIRAFDARTEEGVTIAMTPAQAHGIIAAANDAEGGAA